MDCLYSVFIKPQSIAGLDRYFFTLRFRLSEIYMSKLKTMKYEDALPWGNFRYTRKNTTAFAERAKKQTVIDFRRISTNWLKNKLCPSIRLSRLRAVERLHCKRPIPICRLFFKIDLLTDIAALCLTDLIDWKYIHSMVGIFDPACELLPPWTKELYLCTVAPVSSL